jgi:flagellar biosynthesis protein FliR
VINVAFDNDALLAFLLLFARISGLIMLAPIFGHRAVPAPTRVLFSAFIAGLLFIAGVTEGFLIPQGFGFFVLLLLQETVFGLLLGFLSSLIFTGIGMGARMMGLQGAFAFASVVDPLSQEQGTVIDQLYLLLAALIFLAVDGHHMIIRGLDQSYNIVPIGEFTARTGADGQLLLAQVLDTVRGLFITTFQIAFPVLVPLFISDIAMAVIARSMPQMPVFLIGAPAKIGLLLIMLIMTLPPAVEAMKLVFQAVLEDFFGAMNAAGVGS